MGIQKENFYSTEEVQFAKIGRALSHPARKKILDQLQKRELIKNSDLKNILNLSQPSISDHLEKLKDANLIKEIYCMHYNELHIHPDGFELMRKYLEDLKANFERF